MGVFYRLPFFNKTTFYVSLAYFFIYVSYFYLLLEFIFFFNDCPNIAIMILNLVALLQFMLVSII